MWEGFLYMLPMHLPPTVPGSELPGDRVPPVLLADIYHIVSKKVLDNDDSTRGKVGGEAQGKNVASLAGLGVCMSQRRHNHCCTVCPGW